MRVCVVGIGHVGTVAAACLARDGHEVIAVDINPDKVSLLQRGRSSVLEPGLGELVAAGVASGRLTATIDHKAAVSDAELILICVSTPGRKEDGGLDDRALRSAAGLVGTALVGNGNVPSVVVRSTILPGTMEEVVVPILEEHSGRTAGLGFGAAYMPEFMREGSAIADHDNPSVTVIGSEHTLTVERLRGLSGAGSELRLVEIRTAEGVKYINNAWHALKVGFANEIGQIAKAMGLDGHLLMEIMGLDRRLNISEAYLKPGFAFGGSCLPKDLRALRRRASEEGIEAHLLDAVLRANQAMIDRAAALVLALEPRRVVMIGASFKPGTDDVRESPFLALAAQLTDAGISVAIYDPVLHPDRITGIARRDLDDRLPNFDALLLPDASRLSGDAFDVAILANAALATLLLPMLGGAALVDLVDVAAARARPRYHGLQWLDKS